LHVFMSKLTY